MLQAYVTVYGLVLPSASFSQKCYIYIQHGYNDTSHHNKTMSQLEGTFSNVTTLCNI